jgi:hypothetical protein
MHATIFTFKMNVNSCTALNLFYIHPKKESNVKNENNKEGYDYYEGTKTVKYSFLDPIWITRRSFL